MFDKIAGSKWKNIVLYITVFAFVGTGLIAILLYKFSGQINGVAEVNGEEISVQEFNYNYQNALSMYEQQKMDISSLKNEIKKQVLDNLIDKELLYQEAKKEGVLATKEEVKQEILSIPAFQQNGKFSKDLYLSTLSSLGIAPEFFEKLLQKDLSVQHLLTILQSSVYISDEEVETFTKKQLTKISADIKIIKPQITVSEEEIKNYYQSHQKDFSSETGKKIKVYKIVAKDQQKAEEKAKEIFLTLKSEKEPVLNSDVEKVFDGTIYKEEQLSNLPEDVKKDVLSLSKDKNISFTKSADGFYISKYYGEEIKAIPFETVKEQIAQKLKLEKQPKAIGELYKEISKNNDLSKYNPTSESFNGTLQELIAKYGIKSDDVNPIYKLKEGEISKPLKTDENILQIKINTKQEPTKEETENMKKGMLSIMKAEKFNNILQMYLDKLKEKSKIKINKRLLEE